MSALYGTKKESINHCGNTNELIKLKHRDKNAMDLFNVNPNETANQFPGVFTSKTYIDKQSEEMLTGLRLFWKCPCSNESDKEIGHIISKTGNDYLARAQKAKKKMEFVLESEIPTCPFYLYNEKIIQAIFNCIQEKSFGQLDLQNDIPNRIYRGILLFESTKNKIQIFYTKMEIAKDELLKQQEMEKKR